MQNRGWGGVATKLYGTAVAAVLTATLLSGSSMQGPASGSEHG